MELATLTWKAPSPVWSPALKFWASWWKAAGSRSLGTPKSSTSAICVAVAPFAPAYAIASAVETLYGERTTFPQSERTALKRSKVKEVFPATKVGKSWAAAVGGVRGSSACWLLACEVCAVPHPAKSSTGIIKSDSAITPAEDLFMVASSSPARKYALETAGGAFRFQQRAGCWLRPELRGDWLLLAPS